MKTVISIIIVAGVATLGVAQTKTGNPASTEVRSHKQISRDNRPLYSVTFVERLSQTRDEEVALLTDLDRGSKILLRSMYDYESNTQIREISSVDGKSFVRTVVKFPLQTKTKAAMLAAVKANPALYKLPVVAEYTETTASRRDARADDWKIAANAREWRSDLRTSLSPMFLEDIERLRFGLTRDSFFVPFVLYLMPRIVWSWRPELPAPSIVSVAPDCRYDRSFGFPCSEAQQKKVLAADSKKLLEKY